MKTLAVLFALLCVLATACIQDPEDAEPGKASISDGAELNTAAELTEPAPTKRKAEQENLDSVHIEGGEAVLACDAPGDGGECEPEPAEMAGPERIGEAQQAGSVAYCSAVLAACIVSCKYQPDPAACAKLICLPIYRGCLRLPEP